MRALELLREAGFDRQGSVVAFLCTFAYAYGYALREISMPPRDDSGMPSWYEPATVPQQRFPRLIELAPCFASHDHDTGFDVGLEAILSGLRTKLVRGSSLGARHDAARGTPPPS